MWNFLIILVAIAFYCYRSPFFHKVDPVSYNPNLPAKLDGPLAPNNKLDLTERLHENVLHWPEAFAAFNDKLYTGLGDGRIVEVTPKQIKEICRTGEPCSGQHEEHICGRPLGMTFSKTGTLYVADAYHGLFSVDVKTGQKKNILSAKTVVDGSPLFFLNNVRLDEKEQALYITQSSSKWNLSHVIISIMEHESSGRVLKYDLKTKGVTVLLKDLSFPNGIEFTNDGSALLIAEVNNNRIKKYFKSGEKKGQVTVLPFILPGEPDNIQRNKRGNYWVALVNARSHENPSILDKMAEQPILRKIIIFAHRIIATPISIVMSYLPYDWIKETAFELQTLRIVGDYLPPYGIIVEFNENGKILQSFQSPSGKITQISDAFEHNGYLYLGSWRNRFIGRLKL